MCFFLRAGVLICGFFFCLAPVLKGADRAWADNLFRGSAGEGIIVAVAGPMSGRFSERYRALIRGVRRAVRGNAPAWSVRLISFDDQCSAQGARKAARQVVASGAVAVIGHPCPAAARAAIDVYRKAKLIYFVTGAALTIEDMRGLENVSNVFHFVRPSYRSGLATALRLVSLAKGKGIALVHDTTGYSRRVTRAIEMAFKEQGRGAVFVIALDGARRDINFVVKKIVQRGIGAVHFAGFESEARLLIEQLDKTGVSLSLMGSETLVTKSFLEFVEKRGSRNQMLSQGGRLPVGGGNNGAQAISIGLSVPFTPGSFRVFSSSSRASSIKAMLQGNDLEAHAFSGTQIFMESVRRAGSVRADRVAKTLRVGKFQTQVGKVSFSKTGMADLEPFLFALFDGEVWGALDVHSTE